MKYLVEIEKVYYYTFMVEAESESEAEAEAMTQLPTKLYNTKNVSVTDIYEVDPPDNLDSANDDVYYDDDGAEETYD